jgi:hypothetical protein
MQKRFNTLLLSIFVLLLAHCAQTKSTNPKKSTGNSAAQFSPTPFGSQGYPPPGGTYPPGYTPTFVATMPISTATPPATTTTQELCAYLNGIAEVKQHGAEELAYLCSQGGLEALKAKPDQTVEIAFNKSGNIFTLKLAGTTTVQGDVGLMMQRAQQRAQLYCDNPEEFKTKFGGQSLKDIEYMRPANRVANGCDMDIKTKDIFIVKGAQHIGQQRNFISPTNGIFVGINYLIQSINLTQRSTTLTLTFVENGSIRWLVMQSVVADGKGFADTAATTIKAGFADGINQGKTLATGP